MFNIQKNYKNSFYLNYLSGFSVSIQKRNSIIELFLIHTSLQFNALSSNLKPYLPLRKIPEPISYTKGVTKTRTLVPTGEYLSCGAFGYVLVHRNDPTLVVKKLMERKTVVFAQEFAIGASVNHPNIAKSFQYYIKKLPKNGSVHKIVMERVFGCSIMDFQKPVSLELILKWLNQAKDCCLYLLSEDICWIDVSSSNVMITDDMNLKLVDFGQWFKREEDQEYLANLLYGSVRLADHILSLVIKDGTSRGSRLKISFAEKIFGTTTTPNYLSVNIIAFRLAKKYSSMKPDEQKKVFEEYFDSVINDAAKFDYSKTSGGLNLRE